MGELHNGNHDRASLWQSGYWGEACGRFFWPSGWSTYSKSNCSSLHEHGSGPGPGELTRGSRSHDWPWLFGVSLRTMSKATSELAMILSPGPGINLNLPERSSQGWFFGFYKEILLIKRLLWTSLVVQWVRIHLPLQGTQVQSLLQEDSSGLGAAGPVCHNCWAHETQWEKAHAQQWRPGAAKWINN